MTHTGWLLVLAGEFIKSFLIDKLILFVLNIIINISIVLNAQLIRGSQVGVIVSFTTSIYL